MAALDAPDTADGDVVWRLAQVADDLGIGDRYSSVQFGSPGCKASERRKITKGKREELHRVVNERRMGPTPQTSIAGVLIEADFEKRTAHVRTPTEDLIELVFEEDLADAIYDALRRRSEFDGDVKYDPVTKSVKSVKIRRVLRTDQLLLGSDADAFWQDRTAEQLIADQGKAPVTSFGSLRDDTLSDEEFGEFLAAIRLGEAR